VSGGDQHRSNLESVPPAIEQVEQVHVLRSML
jgi:hypothetical protein